MAGREMKILHVTAGIQETCGVSCFVMETARAQMAAGHDVCIVSAMTCGYPAGALKIRLSDSPEDVDFSPDIVHLHSIWNLYVHRMAVWCRKRKIPYVLSPHGTLSPWALKFKWWKKLPAMLFYQYHDLKRAAAFHITSSAEEKDLRRLRLKQPVITAPPGVSFSESSYDQKERTVLFLGRIHPVKGLDILFRAWSSIAPENRSGWKLVIAGPDDVGYQEKLINLAEESGLRVTDISRELPHGKKQVFGGEEVAAEVYQEKLRKSQGEIIFTGPVYGSAKEFFYRTAKYFVLPSFSENFGSVVLEALAAGTPVLTTTGTPWRDLEKYGCGICTAPEVSALQHVLEKLLVLSEEEYRIMSGKTKEFIKENYLWSRTAGELIAFYQTIQEKQALRKEICSD